MPRKDATSIPTENFPEDPPVNSGHDRLTIRRDHASSRTDKNTVQGQVEMLGDFPRNLCGGNGGGRHSGAVLRTEGGRIIVHLGPAWYFWQHDFPIRAGDMLEVSGSTVVTQARKVIMLAEEVRTKGRKLRLRGEQGLPLWERG